MVAARVWREVEKNKDGRKLKIRLQQVTPDLIDPILEHMRDHFIEREPTCLYTGLPKDPVSTADIMNLWRLTMEKGASIVALLVEENGSTLSTPLIVGVNITGESKKGDPVMMGSGRAYQDIIKAVMGLTLEGNLYEKYKVDKYFTALGLSVHKDYHGLGLGVDILNTREDVAKTMGLTMTATVFSGPISQRVASNAGFHVVLEKDYPDVIVDGEARLKGLPGKLSLMAKSYS